MQRKWICGLLAVIAALVACDKQDLLGSPEAESLRLESMYREIDSLASLYPCEASAEWRFTAIGEKACGGPAGYIAYSTQLDTVDFLTKVDLYTELQKNYNQKWDVVSDCMFLLPPTAVTCEEGKAKLIWDNERYAE